MTELQDRTLISYEENERLTEQIEEIMAEKIFDRAKRKRLKNLNPTVYAPISKQHISYYINKLNETRRNFILRFIAYSVVAVYLLFTLCRIFWYFNPECNPFSSWDSITISDMIVFLYLIPVVIIVYYILKRFLKMKKQ